MTHFWPTTRLTHNLIDPIPILTQPDPPVLPCLTQGKVLLIIIGIYVLKTMESLNITPLECKICISHHLIPMFWTYQLSIWHYSCIILFFYVSICYDLLPSLFFLIYLVNYYFLKYHFFRNYNLLKTYQNESLNK